jgi:hypothetical protein
MQLVETKPEMMDVQLHQKDSLELYNTRARYKQVNVGPGHFRSAGKGTYF